MIVILTDTSAYLTRQEYKDLEVICLPMTYSIGESVYAEGHIDIYDGSAIDFGAGELRTSQPGLSLIRHRFARLRAAGCEVLCITLSSRLSGTYSNASVCAKELGGRGIRVVDSKSAAAGLAMLVKSARSMIEQGATLDETASAVETMRGDVGTVFSVRELTPLRRSGRLGFVRKSVGTILNQRPILTLDNGAVVCSEVARGSADQRRRIAESVPVNAKEAAVQCYELNAEAERLAAQLSERLEMDIPIRRIGAVLGIHLGFDVIGAAWIKG